MTLKAMAEVLAILTPHYNDPSKEWFSAEHDEIYFPATDTPLNEDELKKLKDLNVFQEESEEDDEGDREYLPEEGWKAFT